VDRIEDLQKAYQNALLAYERQEAAQLVAEAVDGGVALRDIYLRVFSPTQYAIGDLWQRGDLSVAQEHFCTNATQTIIAGLYPMMFGDSQGGPRLAALGLEDDLHELGLRMLTDLFEMDGWDTTYLGPRTPSQELTRQLHGLAPDVVAIGVTMPRTLARAGALLTAVRQAVPEARLFLGGYACQHVPEAWRDLGADAGGNDAVEAIAAANAMMRASGQEC